MGGLVALGNSNSRRVLPQECFAEEMNQTSGARDLHQFQRDESIHQSHMFPFKDDRTFLSRPRACGKCAIIGTTFFFFENKTNMERTHPGATSPVRVGEASEDSGKNQRPSVDEAMKLPSENRSKEASPIPTRSQLQNLLRRIARRARALQTSSHGSSDVN